MRHGSLFSGMGGFDLAAEWMGWENIFHCEWNPFGQKILNYYWPKAISYADITKTDFSIHRGHIDVLSGGFPCQPYSTAGKRKGKEDERHLWPHMLRAVREIQPGYVVGENVLGLVNWNGGMVFEEVQADLEAEGYEVQPFILPGASIGAPHKRDRVWFVAYSNSFLQRNGNRSNKERSWRPERGCFESFMDDRNRSQILAGYIGIGDDGLSSRLDGITFSKWRNESIKAGGNAIVPQVALQIFKAIEEYENSTIIK